MIKKPYAFVVLILFFLSPELVRADHSEKFFVNNENGTVVTMENTNNTGILNFSGKEGAARIEIPDYTLKAALPLRDGSIVTFGHGARDGQNYVFKLLKRNNSAPQGWDIADLSPRKIGDALSIFSAHWYDDAKIVPLTFYTPFLELKNGNIVAAFEGTYKSGSSGPFTHIVWILNPTDLSVVKKIGFKLPSGNSEVIPALSFSKRNDRKGFYLVNSLNCGIAAYDETGNVIQTLESDQSLADQCIAKNAQNHDSLTANNQNH